MPRKGESNNQFKKRTGSSSDAPVIIETNINWSESAIVFLEKNLGNCYTSKVLYTKHTSFKDDARIGFSRSFGAKGMLERSRSRLGLVSISQFKLTSGCQAVLEEIVTDKHLHIYLKKDLFDKETYESLYKMIGVTDPSNVPNDDDIGFVFEGTMGNVVAKEDKETEKGYPVEKDININDI
jgi:hypothetical protein